MLALGPVLSNSITPFLTDNGEAIAVGLFCRCDCNRGCDQAEFAQRQDSKCMDLRRNDLLCLT